MLMPVIREAFLEKVTFNSGISADTGDEVVLLAEGTEFTGQEVHDWNTGLEVSRVRNSSVL